MLHSRAAQRAIALQAREADARGDNGVVDPEQGADGSWHANRDITLGANVPGYAECARPTS